MYVYFLNMFIDGRYTFVSIFKEQQTFYTNLDARLNEILEDKHSRVNVCSDGVVVESETPLDNFAGTSFTIVVNGVELEFRVKNWHWVY